jgi:hypothetical protein
MNSNLLPPHWNFSPPFRRLVLSIVALSVLLTFSLLVAPAVKAALPIEGVWSFNGGRIVIQEQQPGVFAGTVVEPTTFSLCAHPEGERIWTQMVEQSDGSYWGEHQWFYETSACIRNPAPGPTAWRVLQNEEGRYLRVCFSEPGSNLQPTITSSGASADATFGCVDSSLLAPLPEASPAQYFSLPTSKSCTARRKLRLQIKNPTNDPVRQVLVTANGGGIKVRAKVQRTKDSIFAVVPLARFASKEIAVKVRLTTLLGEHLTTTRSYRRCPTGKRKVGR